MQTMNNYKHGFFNWFFLLMILLVETGCKKLIEIDTPETSLATGNVYTSDATAISAVTALYTRMSAQNLGFMDFPYFTGTSLYQALKADELSLFDITNERFRIYYQNDLTSRNLGDGNSWSGYYSIIYNVNALIEGLTSSSGLTAAVKQQLLGEAKFMRAFFYFYLVNLYGDVPLIIQTDYRINAILNRTPKDEVYKQIMKDLTEATNEMSDVYVGANVISSSSDRIRPNKWVAKSLMARVLLYTTEYEAAETIATEVINNTSLYDLATVQLTDVFKKNSRETIWALQSIGQGITANTGEGRTFILPANGPDAIFPFYMSNVLYNSFEVDDQRKAAWIGTATSPTTGITYYYPFKYRVGPGINTGIEEYSVVLRLAEIFLIRAESRLHNGDAEGAVSDINAIRMRAGLSPIAVTDEATLESAILHERQCELFTEWGHRWFDLKRTGKLTEVMPIITQQKGGVWNDYKALEPIPSSEIEVSPGLIGHQNPGYN